jgi:hypothetical protein
MSVEVERIRVMWSCASPPAATACMTSLQELDAGAQLEVTPTRVRNFFAVDATVIVTGAATLIAITAEVQKIVCRERKQGIIIDARLVPLSITESSQLPGGTVITITPDGQQITYDACAAGFDLTAIISALAKEQSPS